MRVIKDYARRVEAAAQYSLKFTEEFCSEYGPHLARNKALLALKTQSHYII